MKRFPSKTKKTENVRRQKARPVRQPIRWLKPVLQGMAICVGASLVILGLLQLNQKLSIAYWDIEAEIPLQKQIEQFLVKQGHLDFWHSRAAVLQAGLIQDIPDIQHLQINRILPDGLLLKATARTPIALWEGEGVKSQVMLIDEKGVAYRSLQRGETLDLPILRLQKRELAQAVLVLQALHQQHASKLQDLSEVIVVERDWRLNFAHGEQWKLATAHPDKDIHKIINILAMPRWAQGYWRMDARIPQRWFIRPAKQEVI